MVAIGIKRDNVKGHLRSPVMLVSSQEPTERFEIELSGRPMAVMVQEAERKILCWAMTQTQGNQSKAAVLLGITFGTFKKKIERHDLRAVYQ